MLNKILGLFFAVVLVLVLLALVLPFLVAFLALFVLAAVVFTAGVMFFRIGRGRA